MERLCDGKRWRGGKSHKAHPTCCPWRGSAPQGRDTPRAPGHEVSHRAGTKNLVNGLVRILRASLLRSSGS
eukprot:358787-Prymnesium_polylepis.1